MINQKRAFSILGTIVGLSVSLAATLTMAFEPADMSSRATATLTREREDTSFRNSLSFENSTSATRIYDDRLPNREAAKEIKGSKATDYELIEILIAVSIIVRMTALSKTFDEIFP